MLGRMFLRRLCSATKSCPSYGIVPDTPRYKRIQEMQNTMLRDDGLMVWQKLGVRDMVPLYTTFGLTGFGFIPMIYQFYKMIFPGCPEPEPVCE